MTTIKLDFPTHTMHISKLPTDDDLDISFEAKEGVDLRTVVNICVQHAMVDRIAELEAQLAAVGAGGVTAGVPLMGSALQLATICCAMGCGTPAERAQLKGLAADGELFRRVFEAMVRENETFADNMDRIAGGREGDEPPTLEELRAMLTEALQP